MKIELSKEQVDRVLNALTLASDVMEDKDGKEEMLALGQVIFKQHFNNSSIPCSHNVMIATGNKAFCWKCVDCGYVYGKE